MTDASFRSAGYAVVIEDKPYQKIQSKRKTFAPAAFGSNIFRHSTEKGSLFEKKIGDLGGHSRVHPYFVRSIRTSDCLNGNNSLTLFFRTKAIPTYLWTPCEYVLQFNCKIAHINCSVNTAADFLSRLELKVTEKIRLKIREDAQTTPTDVTTSSSDVADEEQFFFTQADCEDEPGKQILEKNEPSSEKGTELAADAESSSMKPSIKEFKKFNRYTTSYSKKGIKAKART